MAPNPVIDDLDRCKIALQYIAEGQSPSLTAVLELLVERLEAIIGQAHTQLRQCTCQGSTHPRGALTLLRGARQTPSSWAPRDAEE
jgi:hypothetical protein